MLEEFVKKAKFKDWFIILIAAFAIISIWRGFWNILDTYLIPENYLLSQVLSIIVGIIVLMTLSKRKKSK